MITTLCFYLCQIPVFLKTLATTSYALLVYYVLHVASPRTNEAKYFIISHFSCHVCLNINDLAQLECKKLQCVFLTSIIAIRLLYDASGIVTRLLGQLKFNPGLVSQELQPALRAKLRRLCIDDINIDDIRSGWVLSVPDK